MSSEHNNTEQDQSEDQTVAFTNGVKNGVLDHEPEEDLDASAELGQQQEREEEQDQDQEDLIAFDKSENDTEFDKIIGCIEDIVIGDEFQDIQESLLETNYEHFDENVEENKLIYTEIYQEYTKTVEDFIEEQLKQRIENFCMKDFLKELELRKAELEGEVFEMLFTLTDFLAFKEMFVDYKVMKQAGALDNILSVTNL